MSDTGEFVGGTLGSSGWILGLVTVDACVGETSYEMGSGRDGIFNTSSEVAACLGPESTENPIGTAGASTMLGTTTGVTCEIDPNETIIIIRKDNVPYSRIEKNAVDIYNLWHKNKKISFGKTAIITKTVKTYKYFRRLFCLSKDRFDVDKVMVLEGVLERIANEKTDNR